MYCVKCGAELADSLRSCPLCKTPVYYPNIEKEEPERLYPEFVSYDDKISPRGVYFVLSFVFFSAMIITALCDYMLNTSITWGGVAVGGLLLFYSVFLLPSWLPKLPSFVFALFDFLVLALYLHYLSHKTGGAWFFPFALPLVGALALIVLVPMVICHFVKRKLLCLSGFTFIALGAFVILIEWLLNLNFALADRLMWSYCPAAALVLFGIMLLILALSPSLRESIRKRFAL